VSASRPSIDYDGGTRGQVIADLRDIPFPGCPLPPPGGRDALESASARFRRKHVAERWAAKALPPYAATTHALRHSRQTSHSSTLRPSFAMATACLALANARRNECPDLFSDGLSPSVGVYLPTDRHPGWGELYTPTARQARTWSRTVLTRNVNFRSVDLTLTGDVIC
jgi:hypothetical protein